MARRVVGALLALAACARGTSAQFEAATVELDATNELRRRGDCHRKTSVWQMIWTECVCEPCDQCFFDVARLMCALDEEDDEDSSDSVDSTSGSGRDDGSMALTQPLLDPDEWFLTDEEIAESRGGIPRDGLARASEDNIVTLFPATNRFFTSLYSDLKALPDLEDVEAESDEQRTQVMLTGWSVDDIPFLPQKSGGKWNRTTFRHVFGRAIRRGADVRALVWANTLEFMQNAQLQSWMNSIDGPPTRARFLFDNRLPYPTASHHQKTVIIYPPQAPVDNSTETDGASAAEPAIPIAYVGGVDLTNDRWDTVFHNESWLRSRHGVANNYDGWIDASMRIQGRAANDVASNFCMRWNSPMPLLLGDPSTQVFTNPPVNSATNVSCRAFPSANALLTERPFVLINSTSVASVQITRTFSCKVGYDFAPRGEISLLNSRLKAIGKARNYIYIEDQYFVHVPPLRDALLAQLPKIKALVVVTQLPELSTTAVGYGKLFYDMVAPLLAQFPDKVRVFITRPELQLYVHTKAVLIDDVYLSVGSANWNRRSMTSDSEIAATLIDREHLVDDSDGVRVGALAREFRLQKFREFTGREYDDLASMSLLEAVGAMDAAATDSAGIIKPANVRRRAYFDVIPDELIDIADPFDECA